MLDIDESILDLALRQAGLAVNHRPQLTLTRRAGADLADFPTLRSDPEGAARYDAAMVAAAQAIQAVPVPTIAAVEQFALGGGTMIALACDLRICSDDAQFGITASTLGIVYPLSATARLVDVVGPAWARWILFTSERLDANQAHRIGLVHDVVPAGAVLTRAAELAELMSSKAQVSVRGAKELIDRVEDGRRAEDAQVWALYQSAWANAEYRDRALSSEFFDRTLRGSRHRTTD